MGNFNPNDIANLNNNIFGLPYNTDNAKIVILPIPWDVTVSYTYGTAWAPENIFNASMQVDLFDEFMPDFWKFGIAMDEIPKHWLEKNNEYREKANEYIQFLANGGRVEKSIEMKSILDEINANCQLLHNWVERKTIDLLNKNKFVAIIGGEHSVPLGLIKGLTTKYDDFGILHIDAHADLRNAYEGFKYSHASIMYNVLQIPQITKIVQVGIRDYCEDEANIILNSGKITTYFDRNLKELIYSGQTWKSIVNKIVDELPDKVYISFDVDGLDVKYCPNTGTPVPSGLEYEDVMFIFKEIVQRKKTIIGFDICETGFDETNDWDANVAARILYRLSIYATQSISK